MQRIAMLSSQWHSPWRKLVSTKYSFDYSGPLLLLLLDKSTGNHVNEKNIFWRNLYLKEIFAVTF